MSGAKAVLMVVTCSTCKTGCGNTASVQPVAVTIVSTSECIRHFLPPKRPILQYCLHSCVLLYNI